MMDLESAELKINRTTFRKTIYVSLCIFIMLLMFIICLRNWKPFNLINHFKIPSEKKYNTTLKVVLNSDNIPYSFFDDKNNFTGEHVELIYAIADMLKFNVDLEMHTLEDCISLVENGKADIFTGVVFTQKRAEKFRFTIPVAKFNYVAFGKRKTNFTINSLKTSKIGLKKGTWINDVLTLSLQNNLNISTYPDDETCFQKLEEGEIDFTICTESIGNYEIKKNRFKDIEKKNDFIYICESCCATRLDQSELAYKLNSAIIELILSGEVENIHRKWNSYNTRQVSLSWIIKNHASHIMIMLLFTLFIIFIILILNESSRTHTLQQMHDFCVTNNTLSAQLKTEINQYRNAILSNAAYTFCHDVTTGFIENDIFDKNGVSLLQKYNCTSPCLYDKLVENWYEKTILKPIGGSLTNRRNSFLEKMYNEGKKCLDFEYISKEGSYIRNTILLSRDESNGHIISCTIAEDITNYKKLNDLAYLDALTKVGNRASFRAKVDEILEAKLVPYGLVMFDLNNLKKINDTLGHEIGDAYILQAVEFMKKAFENLGIYRIGGDEFTIILKKEECQKSEEYFREFEELTETFNQTDTKFKPIGIHIAYGYAEFKPETNPDIQFSDIFRMADEKMYQKKNELKSNQASH